jgi:deoxycytidylate deaminase
VGAVITDENNSIRSVGWNDVPKGSVPCNIRSLRDVVEPDNIEELDNSYSVFEISKTDKNYAEGGNFSLKTREIFKELVPITEEIGLTHSFCFRSLHNKYEQKDNQVHTRSLHAEENAMLQISKFGGQPLKNGTLYTTASPCELCAKKAYQLGMKKIIYIDPYPGISMKHILENGYNKPNLKLFTGVIGKAYNKLFEPFMSFKDELSIVHKKNSCETNGEKEKSGTQLVVEKLLEKVGNGVLTEKQFKEELIKVTK